MHVLLPLLPQMSRKAVFSGQGFLGSTARISPFEEFEGGLNFRTLQPNGLLFYHKEGVLNKGNRVPPLVHRQPLLTIPPRLLQPDELSIGLENGGVVMTCQGTRVKSHRRQYNDGRTHFLVAWVNRQK